MKSLVHARLLAQDMADRLHTSPTSCKGSASRAQMTLVIDGHRVSVQISVEKPPKNSPSIETFPEIPLSPTNNIDPFLEGIMNRGTDERRF